MKTKMFFSLPRTAMTLLVALVTASAAWADGDVSYLEYNTETKAFDTKTCTTYTTVTDETTAWTAGWYVVSGEVTIETRIGVMGDVHLILANGATFNATKGIGCMEGNSLTIYGQSNDEATMGVLESGQSLSTASTSPEWGYAAIGGENTTTSPVNGTITIHGGKVLAHGTAYGAAIGGGYGSQSNKKDYGTIVINGGIVSADNGSTKSNGQCPAVIGGGTYMTRGHITINGGTVTAYNSNGSGQGAKIGAGTESSWGIITINGGNITVSGFMGASAGNMGAGIGGGVFLTKNDDMTDPELDQIIITGGTINASAAYGAAAIGGGLKGKCGTIRISGGNITANAGLAAAAIGNGNGISVNEGSIIITGGVINATANASNARGAIGGSAAAYGPAITLGWTDENNDRITATTTNASYRGIHGSSVTVADGKAFIANGAGYTPGELTTEQLTAIGSNTLEPAVPVEMNASGIRTYASSYDLDFSGVEGLTAYVVSECSYDTDTQSGVLTLSNVGEVPSATGLLLKGTASQTSAVPIAETATAPESNLLIGVLSSETIVTQTEGDYTNFILANGSHGINWYTLSEDGAIGANKAYLRLDLDDSNGNEVKTFTWVYEDDETTGIEAVENEAVVARRTSWYSMDGQKLNGEPTAKGLYIHNGKKFIK